MKKHDAIIDVDSTPHASPAHDSDADQAGSCLFLHKNPQSTEQLARHLIDKGLLAPSREELITVLDLQGYYRLRGYWITLEENNHFLPGTTLDDILQIETFDREMSQYIFSALAPIEICLRSQLATVLANHYGTQALHCANIFKDEEGYQRMQNALERETLQALAVKKPLAVHHMKKYGSLPVWAEIENTSFGTLSRMFGNLADSAVASEISGQFGISHAHMKNWLRHLTQVRNICAHHDRLYNKMFTVHPRLFAEHRYLHAARLFPTFIVLFRLHESLDPARTNLLRRQLGQIVDAHPTVDLKPIGFPENWREILHIPDSDTSSKARARGRQGGRPLKNADSIEQALYKYDMREATVAEIAKECGLSLSTLYKYIHLRENAKNARRVDYAAVHVP